MSVTDVTSRIAQIQAQLAMLGHSSTVGGTGAPMTAGLQLSLCATCTRRRVPASTS